VRDIEIATVYSRDSMKKGWKATEDAESTERMKERE
jgi:hypothetical protein